MYTTVSNLLPRLSTLKDQDAWQLFEQRYSPIIRLYFRKYSYNESIIGDLSQEAIQAVISGLKEGTYQPSKGRLRTWIAGITRNVLLNHRRRLTRRSPMAHARTRFWSNQEDPDAQSPTDEVNREFDAVWIRSRLSRLLRLAAQSFDTRTLRCYFLVEIRKSPIKEVARRLGLSESAVFQKRRRVANWLLAVGPRFVDNWEH